MSIHLTEAQQQIKDFFAGGKPASYKRRAPLLSYDEPSRDMFYITSGAVKVVSYSRSGNERIHYLYGEGEVFPVMELLGQKQQPVTFIAFSNVTVRLRPMEATIEFYERNPSVLWAVLHQQNEVYRSVVTLNMDTAEEKVGAKLISLARRLGRPEGDKLILSLPLTIQELADMVRLSRETTGKVVNSLEEQGYIIMGRQQLLIAADRLEEALDG